MEGPSHILGVHLNIWIEVTYQQSIAIINPLHLVVYVQRVLILYVHFLLLKYQKEVHISHIES
jgi:hypothetical protein